MSGWRFSWRSLVAWLAGPFASGALIGVALDVVNLVLSPEDKNEALLDGAVLVLGCAVVFLVLTAIPLLVSSVLWRVAKRWPRPWAEMGVVAALCFGLVHAPGVSINFAFDGPSSQLYCGLVFFSVNVVPILTGLLAPFVYWLVAKPKRA